MGDKKDLSLTDVLAVSKQMRELQSVGLLGAVPTVPAAPAPAPAPTDEWHGAYEGYGKGYGYDSWGKGYGKGYGGGKGKGGKGKTDYWQSGSSSSNNHRAYACWICKGDHLVGDCEVLKRVVASVDTVAEMEKTVKETAGKVDALQQKCDKWSSEGWAAGPPPEDLSLDLAAMQSNVDTLAISVSKVTAAFGAIQGKSKELKTQADKMEKRVNDVCLTVAANHSYAKAEVGRVEAHLSRKHVLLEKSLDKLAPARKRRGAATADDDEEDIPSLTPRPQRQKSKSKKGHEFREDILARDRVASRPPVDIARSIEKRREVASTVPAGAAARSKRGTAPQMPFFEEPEEGLSSSSAERRRQKAAEAEHMEEGVAQQTSPAVQKAAQQASELAGRLQAEVAEAAANL